LEFEDQSLHASSIILGTQQIYPQVYNTVKAYGRFNCLLEVQDVRLSAMNTSPTSTPSGNETTAIPPELTAEILQAYATAIRPPISLLLTSTIFGSMLIPLLIILFYFSTPSSRRRPIFILNVLSAMVGIGMAIGVDCVVVSIS
jgi:hypothetical protein